VRGHLRELDGVVGELVGFACGGEVRRQEKRSVMVSGLSVLQKLQVRGKS